MNIFHIISKRSFLKKNYIILKDANTGNKLAKYQTYFKNGPMAGGNIAQWHKCLSGKCKVQS